MQLIWNSKEVDSFVLAVRRTAQHFAFDPLSQILFVGRVLSSFKAAQVSSHRKADRGTSSLARILAETRLLSCL